MNAHQINSSLLNPAGVHNASFEGFANGKEHGWYSHGTGPETRPESEERAAKFYVWMMEYLNQQLREAETQDTRDIFDAGVALHTEEHEQCHDRLGPRTRRRRTVIFVGHGDFMSLVLKRIVAGFGHAVEQEAVPHVSAFVHYNTGITELEYFGNGRFLIMSQNNAPHLSNADGSCYTGGSLKDGWSYLMPKDGCLDSEVLIAFSDEVQPHIHEQTVALRSLYLPKKESASNNNKVKGAGNDAGTELTVVVKQGLQVVGCASLNEKTGRLSDIVVRPSAHRRRVGQSLVEAAKNHAKRSNIDKIVAHTSLEQFESMGFSSTEKGVENIQSDGLYSSEVFRMECKL